MKLNHRPVKASDVKVICGFPQNAQELFFMFPKAHFPLTETQLITAISQRFDSTVVAINGTVVGFANFYRAERNGVCCIGNVIVSPSARGEGVATFIVETMTRLAFERYGAQEVHISCFNENTAGLLLYPKLGFVPYAIEERPSLGNSRSALIHMTRSTNVNSTAYLAKGDGLGNRMMKVDHAGEHGAICIYSGQLFMARLFVPGMVDELKEFLSHERRHRTVFQKELQRRNYPRCRSYWLCGIGGLALGLVTGICGRKAIVATTVAVESVVLKHLAHQLDVLGDIDLHAVAAITSIVEDEQHHHDHSAAQIDVRDPWFRVLAPMVTAWTEAVIWMGMRS